MQYKVPQNIDKPDQILGTLTLVQFTYLAVGGALIVVINQISNVLLNRLLMIIDAAVFLSLAFLKIQDQPLISFMLSVFKYAKSPKTRAWNKISTKPIINQTTEQEKTTATPHKTLNYDKLLEATEKIDTRGNPQTIDQKTVFKNIDSKIFNEKKP